MRCLQVRDGNGKGKRDQEHDQFRNATDSGFMCIVRGLLAAQSPHFLALSYVTLSQHTVTHILTLNMHWSRFRFHSFLQICRRLSHCSRAIWCCRRLVDCSWTTRFRLRHRLYRLLQIQWCNRLYFRRLFGLNGLLLIAIEWISLLCFATWNSAHWVAVSFKSSALLRTR